jgi:SnoaL-like protein
VSTERNRADTFRHAIEAMDVEAVVQTLAPGVVFNSPIVHKPYYGREAVGFVLAGVMRVFRDFRYVAEYASPDGHVLRFRTRVGEREVDGVDILTFNADGLIAEFSVMVRPYSAATALREAMAAELAAYTQSNTDQRS